MKSNETETRKSSIVQNLIGTKGKLRPLIAFLSSAGTLAMAVLAYASSSTQVEQLAPLAVPRTAHTATVLADGSVLITGGRDAAGTALAVAEIFDPKTRISKAIGDLVTARTRHTATLLKDGRVLIAGGTNATGTLASAEIFEPLAPSSGFHALDAAMGAPRTRHTATLLNDGKVLLAGGDSAGSAELFDPASETFSVTLLSMAEPRSGHTATLFSDNTVLLAGGRTDSIETFNAADQTFTLEPQRMTAVRISHEAIALSDTRLLFFGRGAANTIDEWDFSTDTLALKATMDAPASSATLLANGNILVLRSDLAGIYAPDAADQNSAFTAFDQLAMPGSGLLARRGQTATELPDDKRILVAGGVNTNNNLVKRVALFNPARIWTDKDDYYPEEIVLLNGSGWKPNEDIYLFVVDSATDQWTYKSTEKADANGNFAVDPYFIVEQRRLGVTFNLTAYGAESTMQAGVTFTDAGQFEYFASPSPFFTILPGNSDSFSESVKAPKNNGTFSAELVMNGTGGTPIPSGWMSMSQGARRFRTGDSSGTAVTKNWTVTINVPAGTLDGTYTGTITANVTSGTGPGTSTGTAVTVRVGATSGAKVGSVAVGSQTGTLTAGTGGTATYNINVKRGTTGAFTADLSAGALPSGASAVFSPSSLSFTSTDSSKTAALTITSSNSTLGGTTNFSVTATNAVSPIDAASVVGIFKVGSKVTPTINWSNPANITYGTALSGTQLNATATVGGNTVAGSFVYTPAVGTVLNVGDSQTLSVTFTPTDTSNYNTANKSVSLNVNKASSTTTVTVNNASYDGLSHGGTASVTGGGGLNQTLTVSYSGRNTTTYGPSATAPSNAGDYTASASFVGDANHNSSSDTKDYSIAQKNATWTTNPNSKTYGGADPSPLTTGRGSGFLAADNVTATYSRDPGNAVVAGGYHITATLSPGSVLGNYNITNAGANFTINKKDASVTPNATSKIYGGVDPAFTGTLTGFLPADGVSATYGRAPGETVAGSPYTISATLSPAAVLGNYEITYNTAEFAINKKDASVTPNAASKIYGGVDPALTGALSGFLAGDSVSAAYNRAPGETVAGYTISATLSPAGVLGNYEITYNTAEFTINKKDASVTPNAASKIYGSADPALSGTLVGFLAGDGVSATYNRAPGETVAGYTISATLSPAAVLGNYDITYNTAEFTINKKDASVTPNAASKTYGSVDPALSGTLSGFLAGDSVTAAYNRAPGETVAGYTISATLSPAAVLGNYDITYNTAEFKINKATPTITVAADPMLIFDGNAHSTTATAVGVDGTTAVTGSFSFTYDLSAAAPTNAKTSYEVVATFTSTNPNYNGAMGTGALTISKASSTTTVSVSNATSDGSSHGGSASVTGAGGLNQSLNVYYTGRNGTTYASSMAAPINAGDYTGSASYTGDDNHTGSSDSKNYGIGKAKWSTGPKKVLVVRGDFSDLPDIRPVSVFTDLMAQVGTKYENASYGQTTLETKVTKVYRMPKTGKAYAIADDWSIDTDIRAAAARDYDLDSYDRVILTWPSLAKLDGSRMKWSGYGLIGGRYIWLNGYWTFRAVSHELGHTYGFDHAGANGIERGDPFDIMGWLKTDQRSDFSPYAKHRMGWLSDDHVKFVTQSGTYRVERMDTRNPADGELALKVGVHWVFLRRNYPRNETLYNGVCIIRERGNGTMLDGIYAVGETFSDGDIKITPTEKGDGWMNVEVVL